MKAITATARKLACMFYSMLKNGTAYVEKGMEKYEEHYQERVLKSLQRRAHDLGFNLTKVPGEIAQSV